jgi:hypothetical protein
MPLTLLSPISSILTLLALMVYSTGATPVKKQTTLIEVWSVGDAALTVKLRDELETAFKSSSDFQLSSGNKPGTLVVTIPTNVGWKHVGKRTRVFYKAEFSLTNNEHLGQIKGRCWQDELASCATQIINRARIVARKVH